MSNYKLFAQHLGPILSMQKGELSKKRRNLIFARNGTGKSFLSRAFLYLDRHGQGEDINKAAYYLVSEESTNGTGSFKFTCGNEILGELKLTKGTGENDSRACASIPSGTIFHVFTNDFVQAELRNREFEIDGHIEKQIILAKDNIELSEKETELEKAQGEKDATKNDVEEKFNKEKNTKLVNKAEIRRSLREYSELNLNDVETLFEKKPLFPDPSLRTIIEQLEKLKSIPANIDKPNDVDLVEFDIADIDTSLKKPISPSSVADDIKDRISRDQEFYEKGLKIIDSDGSDTCPFCEQGITSADPRAIIDAYMKYFDDAESKHKNKLKEFDEALKRLRSSIDNFMNLTFKQKSKFDKLKAYIPPQKDIEIEINEELIIDVLDTIEKIKNIIGQKIRSLSSKYTISNIELSEKIQNINTIIETNNKKVNTLNSAVQDTTDVRKGLQRDACKTFKTEFVIQHWNEIQNLLAHSLRINDIQAELKKLKNARPLKPARDRVAETFKILLNYFFQEKYTFDADEFVIKRENKKMERGPDHTLSDGEKTIIAFCYFIASIHLKVKSDDDYEKLFLVFDDPVTSVSYDFIFAIVETLKNLNISNSGKILIFPRNTSLRPKFLILTHNSYFYSICITQGVIDEKAGFSFEIDEGEHIFTNLEKYAFPFKHQLKHIYEIAKGRQKPEFYTANSIRSVLEEIGRFCRPDKAKTTKGFIDFLSSDMDISINIHLLNCLSHGLPTEEVTSQIEICKACKQTIRAVEELAPGQIEILKREQPARQRYLKELLRIIAAIRGHFIKK